MAALNDNEVNVIRNAIRSVGGYLVERYDDPSGHRTEILEQAHAAVTTGLYVLGMAHAEAVAECVADGMDEGEAIDQCEERLRVALVGMMTGKGSP